MTKRVAPLPHALIGLVLCAALAAGVAHGEGGDVLTQAETARRLADDAQRRATSLRQSNDQLAARIAAIGKRIVARETAVSSREDKISALRRDIANAEARLARAENRLALLAQALQRIRREPSSAILTRPHRARVAARTHAQIRALMRQFEGEAKAARREIKRIAAADHTANAEEASAAQERDKLRREIAEAEKLLLRKRRLEKDEDARAAAAAARAARLEAKAANAGELAASYSSTNAEPLRDSERQSAAIGSVERPNAATSPPQKNAKAATNPESTTAKPPHLGANAGDSLRQVDAADAPQIAFASAKGRLLPPAAGDLQPIRGRKGARGALLVTRSHARVIAPWRGVVRFAGFYRSHRVVIIEPETGYSILLTGLGEVIAQKGERVEAGQLIGRMPASAGKGAVSREELYISLFRRSAELDSAPWFEKATKEVGEL